MVLRESLVCGFGQGRGGVGKGEELGRRAGPAGRPAPRGKSCPGEHMCLFPCQEHMLSAPAPDPPSCNAVPSHSCVNLPAQPRARAVILAQDNCDDNSCQHQRQHNTANHVAAQDIITVSLQFQPGHKAFHRKGGCVVWFCLGAESEAAMDGFPRTERRT